MEGKKRTKVSLILFLRVFLHYFFRRWDTRTWDARRRGWTSPCAGTATVPLRTRKSSYNTRRPSTTNALGATKSTPPLRGLDLDCRGAIVHLFYFFLSDFQRRVGWSSTAPRYTKKQSPSTHALLPNSVVGLVILSVSSLQSPTPPSIVLSLPVFLPSLIIMLPPPYRVPNAKPGRETTQHEIYGMDGVPAGGGGGGDDDDDGEGEPDSKKPRIDDPSSAHLLSPGLAAARPGSVPLPPPLFSLSLSPFLAILCVLLTTLSCSLSLLSLLSSLPLGCPCMYVTAASGACQCRRG